MLESEAKNLSQAALPAAWRLYERIDHVRSRQGEWLETLGWGPQETPSRIVFQRPGLTLKGYVPPVGDGPVILLVPAPIKRAYIWDLGPGASVVQACIQKGLRPYLVQWEPPEPGAGLGEYGDRFLVQCVEAIRAETGAEQVILAGHSLGGILAAVFAAVNPSLAAGLIILGAPLQFSVNPEHGALGPVVESVGAKRLLSELPDRVPGSVLSMAGFMASPTAFGKERLTDWFRSIHDAEAIKTHMQVERWSMDELPLAGRLVDSLVQQLYRGDAFMAGNLACGSKVAAARNVAAPLLVVAEEKCGIVPPASVMPFVEAVASQEKQVLWYEGDVGVAIQHVGSLVGRNAHARLWPRILDWTRKIWPKLG